MKGKSFQLFLPLLCQYTSDVSAVLLVFPSKVSYRQLGRCEFLLPHSFWCTFVMWKKAETESWLVQSQSLKDIFNPHSSFADIHLSHTNESLHMAGHLANAGWIECTVSSKMKFSFMFFYRGPSFFLYSESFIQLLSAYLHALLEGDVP